MSRPSGAKNNWQTPSRGEHQSTIQSRGRRVQFSHLTWAGDKGQYGCVGRIPSRSNEDLTGRGARPIDWLRDSKTNIIQSQISKSASASAVNETVAAIDVSRAKKQKILRQIKLAKARTAHDLGRRKEPEEAFETAKKCTRGKSAKTMETQLLSESTKSTSGGIEEDIKNKMLSAHSEMMCKRMQKRLEENLTEPLKELLGFDRKTAKYFADKR